MRASEGRSIDGAVFKSASSNHFSPAESVGSVGSRMVSLGW